MDVNVYISYIVLHYSIYYLSCTTKSNNQWKCYCIDKGRSVHHFLLHDDVMKGKHFPRYWPFVRGICRSPVNSPHNGLRRGALMFSLIYTWINGWVNNCEAGDFWRHRAHYDATVKVDRLVHPKNFVYDACFVMFSCDKLMANLNHIINSLRPSDAYMRQWSNQHCGSDNGLSPGRRQAIVRTNTGILLIRPSGTNFSDFLVEILTFSFKKMRLKVLSAKQRPFCLGLNVLRVISLLE